MDSSFNTCLIIESGATSTVVTPIINSRIQQDAVQFKPVGGLQVSLALADTITSKGIVNEVGQSQGLIQGLGRVECDNSRIQGIQQDAVQFIPVSGLQVSLALADTITSKGILGS